MDPIYMAKPSKMSLLLTMSVNGLDLAAGTGFIVQRAGVDYLITNRHNLSGRHYETNEPLHSSAACPDTVSIWHNAADNMLAWESRTERLLDDAGRPLWLEHPLFGRKVDVVALPLTNLNNVVTYPYDPWQTKPDIQITVGQSLSIIGFPFGVTGSGRLGVWVRGFIATEPIIDWNGLPLFLVDSRTRTGQSGSPVVFWQNGGTITMTGGATGIFGHAVERFFGVYSGRINAQSDLGFVWKASAVCAILESGVRNDAE
jgi:hypothetical protein